VNSYTDYIVPAQIRYGTFRKRNILRLIISFTYDPLLQSDKLKKHDSHLSGQATAASTWNISQYNSHGEIYM
jgi:hypothetical protein